MNRQLFYLIIALFVAVSLSGCLQIRLRTANESYQQFAYAEAAKDYEWVLTKKKIPEATILLKSHFSLSIFFSFCFTFLRL